MADIKHFEGCTCYFCHNDKAPVLWSKKARQWIADHERYLASLERLLKE